MAEPVQAQPIQGVTTQEPAVTTEPAVQGNDELAALKAQIDSMNKQFELTKKELSSRDKVITELKKKEMTEAELLAQEKKEMRESNLKIKQSLMKEKLKLDDGFESLLGTEFEQIDINADLLTKYAQKIVSEKDNKIKELELELQKYKTSTGNPGKGAVVNIGIDQQIADAKKNGDLALASKLYLEKMQGQT